MSNGHHAEVVRVPKNLCAKVPDAVDDESASFAVLASIGLQGIRLINPTIGESIVVFGLGLIGLLTVQMLRANGCRVLGIDFDRARCAMARQFGAEAVDLSRNEDPVVVAQAFSGGLGVDGVVVTATTQSDDLIHQAAEMCRKRARIVLVGVVGLNLRRDDFYEKELTFQVSASYGPGRYDPLYEEAGQDYPVGFVRWTEQRNFEAVLDMMVAGSLNVKPLISHRYSLEDAAHAYDLLSDTSVLGILLNYPHRSESTLMEPIVQLGKGFSSQNISSSEPVVGFIGAGNYASRVLIPNFKKVGATLDTIVTSGGLSGVYHGTRAGFVAASTELEAIWGNSLINAVVIATRHNQHAPQVIKALEVGKHVFVEKPLALSLSDLSKIEAAYSWANRDGSKGVQLMVGFNRRFAPHIVQMKKLLEAKQEPKVIIFTVNAGVIPATHWTQDRQIGGGRIIGECCHFVDLMRFLVGHRIIDYRALMVGDSPAFEVRDDKVSITISFSDGSMGTIHYLANGGNSFPKERIEVFCGDAVLRMNNYKSLQGFGWPGFSASKSWRQDKGQTACVASFVNAIRSGDQQPISFNEIIEVSRATIEISESLRFVR